jgi:hypothetical protein
MTRKAKPLKFLIDAASVYSHQLQSQGFFDHAVTIKLGVELAIERWGASERDAKFLRDNIPPVPKGAIPPHDMEWKPEKKFGRVVMTIKALDASPVLVN